MLFLSRVSLKVGKAFGLQHQLNQSKYELCTLKWNWILCLLNCGYLHYSIVMYYDPGIETNLSTKSHVQIWKNLDEIFAQSNLHNPVFIAQ